MFLNTLLSQHNMSVYQLAKTSHLPYTTVNDICTGKTQLKKCNAETVYRIAQAFHISMEELLAPSFASRNSFENFKSNGIPKASIFWLCWIISVVSTMFPCAVIMMICGSIPWKNPFIPPESYLCPLH